MTNTYEKNISSLQVGIMEPFEICNGVGFLPIDDHVHEDEVSQVSTCEAVLPAQ